MTRVLLAVAMAVLLCGCADQNPMPGQGTAPGPSAPLAKPVLSLPSCEHHTFVTHVGEEEAQALMGPGYESDGDVVVLLVVALFDCPVATVDAAALADAAIAVTYVYLDSRSAVAGEHAYAVEVLVSAPELAAFFLRAGFAAAQADFAVGLGLQGGGFSITAPGLSYQGTVAGAMDEDGIVSDEAYLFTQWNAGREARLLHVRTHDAAARLNVPATLAAEGGAWGAAFPSPAVPALAHRAVLDATFEEPAA